MARGRENLVSCSQDGRRLRRSRDRVQGDDGGVVDDVCRVSSSTSDDVEVDDQQQTSGSAAPVKVEATAEPQPGPSRSSPQPGPSGTSLSPTEWSFVAMAVILTLKWGIWQHRWCLSSSKIKFRPWYFDLLLTDFSSLASYALKRLAPLVTSWIFFYNNVSHNNTRQLLPEHQLLLPSTGFLIIVRSYLLDDN